MNDSRTRRLVRQLVSVWRGAHHGVLESGRGDGIHACRYAYFLQV